MLTHVHLKPFNLYALTISFLPKLSMQVPFLIRIRKSSEIVLSKGKVKRRVFSIKTKLNPLERPDKGGEGLPEFTAIKLGVMGEL